MTIDTPGIATEAPTAAEVAAQVHDWLARSRAHPVDGSARMLARLLGDPGGLPFLTALVDGVVRPEDRRVAAASLRRVVGRDLSFLPAYQRGLLAAGSAASRVVPGIVVGTVRLVVRRMVGHLVVDATPARLGRALARLRRTGSRLNLNLLGEAVLGAGEADRRLARTLALIERDDVDYVSLKVSAAVAPHNPWAFDQAVEQICARLDPLYAAAARTGTFVNLDMEEYRDLDLTVAVFTRLLDVPRHRELTAGIVLQAYLPDSLAALDGLTEWAQRRVRDGGAPIKVRLVKGANLSMERVDAELHGWPVATWGSKLESDAHYKRLLDRALVRERTAAVHVGVAGHNLFDVAFALLLARGRGVDDAVDFEMLLGMGEHVAATVAEDVGPLRLYTPVVHPAEFDVALAYLVRRLEEVASRENFMSSLYDLDRDPGVFARERARFEAALALASRPAVASHRRRAEAGPAGGAFRNASDTDPAVPDARSWAAGVRRLAEAGELGRATVTASRVDDPAALDDRLATASAGAGGWQALAPERRAAILRAAADAMERRRDALVAVMMSEAGKTLDQGDPEVSEAIDFARYYADRSLDLVGLAGATPVPRAVTLVTPPWNFPVAIPAGGVLAALAAGSAVVLKPAEQAPRCAAVVAEALWEAGVPRDALVLVDLDPDALGERLVGDPRIDQVILTGAFETAELFHRIRPGLRLLAETSGKNAIVVTPSADLDLAARDVVASAFGHAGQKCSAASLAILVGSVATSERFLGQLVDATRSLEVGEATDASAQVGPLIGPAEGKLLRALTSLEPGERWLVEPRRLDPAGRVWSPGIRTGVQPGSWFHLTECFGPVLGLIAARDLDHALEIQNAVDFGLTAGLHSLDPDEIARWSAAVEAGNVYVDRGITGAIVQRQPFGGWKRSVVGPSAKAGGPSYLYALTGWERVTDLEPAHVDDALLADTAPWVHAAVAADAPVWARMAAPVDRSGLACERNALRHRPAPAEIRWDGADVDALLRVCAARVRVGGTGGVSTQEEPDPDLRARLGAAGLAVAVEDEPALLARLAEVPGARVRCVGRPVAPTASVAVYDAPVTAAPELELLPFAREQAVSVTMHRFGTPWPAGEAALRPVDRPEDARS
ncbi:bifunctional proline dehydrogenase/L-glutamate gamma-semialdehyde dehydrogenase [Demequina sp. SYSU T00068]|uniref:bifunctional proline dehydrogenase/L-glutamate gamma-semialdehyde dehydrogenase n=1 Tax=Demequina lignilytica TaxID=3051663 RepID=UPI002622172F|nr:bifunctional proline dehydrogenase/L-glutamate gamma-semialdehyde dehydrogenase [Demequina sp. SYSU T00068]MDN4489337.1 bifunctional proline dehydrogenase/L-glutamate gamma-semialdehyde dehydrogenase [Demequina sp. SYSU T00068]